MAERISTSTLWGSAQTINATASITSPVIDTGEMLGDACGLLLVATGSAVDVDVTIQCSVDGDTFYDPTDSSGDASAVVTITDTTWYQFVPPIAPYIQLTATGGASNGTDTTLTGKLVRQIAN